MTDTATVTVEPSPAPGPGGRVSRMSGQIGGSVVLLDLWLAFGWLGADGWTERQLLAVSAVTYWLIGASHNVFNWWQSREHRTVVESVTVTSTPPPEKRTTKKS